VILLVSTSDKLQIVTGSAVTVDVHASFMDYNGSTVTPGRTNTLISTATTTDVVAAPGSGVQRNVKTLNARNRHASSSVLVTVQHTDGTNTVELFQQTLLAGQTLQYIEGVGFSVVGPTALPTGADWQTHIIGAYGDANPNTLIMMMQKDVNVAPTPTNISTSVARCSMFRPPSTITINRIRFYGVGAVTSIYTCALYRYSDLARLTASLTLTTTANAWGSVGSALNVTLTGGVLYFIAVGANTTGTTAGLVAFGDTLGDTTGRIQAAPGALPGGLDFDNNYMSGYQFQFTVSGGVMPDPAATLALQGLWTGGMPAFWLDNEDT
jgi:hypothetical protein